jgi:hypothetical protein
MSMEDIAAEFELDLANVDGKIGRENQKSF